MEGISNFFGNVKSYLGKKLFGQQHHYELLPQVEPTSSPQSPLAAQQHAQPHPEPKHPSASTLLAHLEVTAHRQHSKDASTIALTDHGHGPSIFEHNPHSANVAALPKERRDALTTQTPHIHVGG